MTYDMTDPVAAKAQRDARVARLKRVLAGFEGEIPEDIAAADTVKGGNSQIGAAGLIPWTLRDMLAAPPAATGPSGPVASLPPAPLPPPPVGNPGFTPEEEDEFGIRKSQKATR